MAGRIHHHDNMLMLIHFNVAQHFSLLLSFSIISLFSGRSSVTAPRLRLIFHRASFAVRCSFVLFCFSRSHLPRLRPLRRPHLLRRTLAPIGSDEIFDWLFFLIVV